MKGISHTEFGAPEVLSYGELPDPIVHLDEALVRVHAVGVNHLEAGIRAGYLTPFFNHFPPIIPGFDFAGEIVSAGYTLEDYQPGDRVLGTALKDYVKNGTYAELVAVPGRLLARVPEGLDLIEAAALPTAGLAAWQSLRPLVGEGDTVFINSASGGVGHLAVQLARHFGASTVVGACSPGNHEFVRSLGGIPTEYGPGIESRVAELVGGDGRVDAVLDLVGDETLDSSFAIVRKPDHVVCLNPSTVEQRGGHFSAARPNQNDLEELARLASAGDLHVEISKTIPLELAADAHHLIQDRHVRGKLVLSVKP
ncbi:NADP-dependent oxidoreductase (plasmid) [Streptomyces sp. NBC_01450]|uniref:NADP-dependent oxidoreductase n=1 Tax=Streptomyces sp. NBC_01450 TaxID=2903871 RepID=UPI002E35BA9C|nr:NADP-dependent oxidoreductase [Streptomyces sp. NBC_01450]